MTRILLTGVCLFSFSFFAQAQFMKGSALLGGTFSFTGNQSSLSNSPDETSTNNGYFNISLGKAIRENAVFGGYINYQYNSQKYGGNSIPGKSRTDGYGIGIFYRLYKNLGKEFYFFGEAGGGYAGYSASSEDNLGNKSTGHSNGGQIYLSPGIAYKISKKFFVELSIPQLFNASYFSGKSESGTVTSSNNYFNVNANLNSNPLTSLGLGFRLVL
jgi:hypothetical protein